MQLTWYSIVALAIVSIVAQARGAIYAESGDAGETLVTSQGTGGLSPLDQIAGNLVASNADIFSINIHVPAAFSATTVGGASFDTALFLFDSAGNGVLFSDDSSNTIRSTLPAGSLPGPAGLYYLAISSWDYDPNSTSGEIFL